MNTQAKVALGKQAHPERYKNGEIIEQVRKLIKAAKWAAYALEHGTNVNTRKLHAIIGETDALLSVKERDQ